MVEVGDMIVYKFSEEEDLPERNDLGWVVYIEEHPRSGGTAHLLHVKWMNEKNIDMMWDHDLILHKEFTLVKGG